MHNLIKTFQQHKDIAVVFGLFETGLGVIRALGRQGVHVIGIDFKKDIAYFSRYGTKLICPHPLENRSMFLQWIQDTFGKAGRVFPVFITGDDFLKVISEERKELKANFLINLPPDQLIRDISDKYSQYQLAVRAGIGVPFTWLIAEPADLDVLQKNNIWPLLLKGREVNSWRRLFGGSVKGFLIRDYHELKEKTRTTLDHQIPVIVQEIVEGPDTNHFKYCAYVSGDGQILAELCLRKIRQRPIHFGIGSVVESIHDPELLETGRKFFRSINYCGTGSAEFKRDLKSGELKLIELNCRYWQQNSLAEASGVNFPLIHYQDVSGEKPKPVLLHQAGIKWVNRYMDFESFLGYRREGTLDFCQWCRSLRGKKIYPDFTWDDPLPALYEIGFGLKLLRLPGYLIRKVSGK